MAPPVLAQEAPPAQAQVKAPVPTVPEVFTLLGQFVRVAYNNEGYVTLAYRTANAALGQEWMLLDIGITVREKVPNYTLKRGDLRLKTPDGTVLPLATQEQYSKASLRGLENMANHDSDTVNYFPAGVSRPRPLAFFTNAQKSSLAYDQVELDDQSACMGRIYFHVPGGIKTGQHWLLVTFAGSEVQVPFRILTKEEEKEFRKTWKDIKKAHDASMK
jgi:hypothetical protein